ncbi:MAG: dockerin type I repeat-containing protein, partial [Ignavibacteriaceae bacterium]|nr:dockerin type I repeat-containing protein [Ignavibacteriaceae bacterium]
LVEAMYVSGGSAMTTTPSVTVELHDASTFAVVESKPGTLSTAGVGTFLFTTSANGTPYYLVVKSANSVETWSASTVSFTGGALSYDFTTGLDKAYTDGSNPPLVIHGAKYCIYSGDVNQDGQVTSDDFTGVDNDNTNFDYHVANDVNGDGQVTSDDFTFIDNNNTNFVARQIPPGAPIVAKRVVRSNSVQKSSVVK